jgi:hypothetical protein
MEIIGFSIIKKYFSRKFMFRKNLFTIFMMIVLGVGFLGCGVSGKLVQFSESGQHNKAISFYEEKYKYFSENPLDNDDFKTVKKSALYVENQYKDILQNQIEKREVVFNSFNSLRDYQKLKSWKRESKKYISDYRSYKILEITQFQNSELILKLQTLINSLENEMYPKVKEITLQELKNGKNFQTLKRELPFSNNRNINLLNELIPQILSEVKTTALLNIKKGKSFNEIKDELPFFNIYKLEFMSKLATENFQLFKKRKDLYREFAKNLNRQEITNNYFNLACNNKSSLDKIQCFHQVKLDIRKTPTNFKVTGYDLKGSQCTSNSDFSNYWDLENPPKIGKDEIAVIRYCEDRGVEILETKERKVEKKKFIGTTQVENPEYRQALKNYQDKVNANHYVPLERCDDAYSGLIWVSENVECKRANIEEKQAFKILSITPKTRPEKIYESYFIKQVFVKAIKKFRNHIFILSSDSKRFQHLFLNKNSETKTIGKNEFSFDTFKHTQTPFSYSDFSKLKKEKPVTVKFLKKLIK